MKTDSQHETGEHSGASHCSLVSVGDKIAREIFTMGDEPSSPCNRIQFLGGSWADDDEHPQGGLCESALAKHIDSLLMKYQANTSVSDPHSLKGSANNQSVNG